MSTDKFKISNWEKNIAQDVIPGRYFFVMQKFRHLWLANFFTDLYFTAAAAILAFPCSATSAAFSVVAIIALFAHSSHAGSTATRTRPFITICSRASARTITNGTFAVTVACAASRTTGARIPSRHLTFLYYRDGPVIDLALSFFLFPHVFLADNGYLCQPEPTVGPNMRSVWHKQAG